MADQYWQSVPFIGLSATPWTHGLGRHYDDLIIPATTGDLVRTGFLCPFVASAPSSARPHGRPHDCWRLPDRRTSPRGAIRRRLSPTLSTRGFGLGSTYRLRYSASGARADFRPLPCGGRARRLQRREPHGRSHLPMVSSVIDARPTKSEMRFVRTIGRGDTSGQEQSDRARPCGNHLRRGTILDIHHDHLDDGERLRAANRDEKSGGAAPRLCDECKAVMPRAAIRWSAAGYVRRSRRS